MYNIGTIINVNGSSLVQLVLNNYIKNNAELATVSLLRGHTLKVIILFVFLFLSVCILQYMPYRFLSLLLINADLIEPVTVLNVRRTALIAFELLLNSMINTNYVGC